MSKHRFETVDVFTDRRFGGNPLAVFPDARGIADLDMQRLAFEFNLSETTFVLPPENTLNAARIRIFNRSHEMPFAGHPMVGTAFVLARLMKEPVLSLRFEVPAGVVAIRLSRRNDEIQGAVIDAPAAARPGHSDSRAPNRPVRRPRQLGHRQLQPPSDPGLRREHLRHRGSR